MVPGLHLANVLMLHWVRKAMHPALFWAEFISIYRQSALRTRRFSGGFAHAIAHIIPLLDPVGAIRGACERWGGSMF